MNQIENCTNQKQKKIMECIKRREIKKKDPFEISKNSTVIFSIHHQHHH